MVNYYKRTPMYTLFVVYFGQDYDLFTDINRDKPLIPQFIQSFKRDCSSSELKRCIDELSNLIAFNYSEEELKNQVFSKLRIPGNPGYYGLSHQQFLREVLKVLKE